MPITDYAGAGLNHLDGNRATRDAQPDTPAPRARRYLPIAMIDTNPEQEPPFDGDAIWPYAFWWRFALESGRTVWVCNPHPEPGDEPGSMEAAHSGLYDDVGDEASLTDDEADELDLLFHTEFHYWTWDSTLGY